MTGNNAVVNALANPAFTTVTSSGQITSNGNNVVEAPRLVATGAGLTGGGNLSADRTITLDIPGMTEKLTPSLHEDFFATQDTGASLPKKVKMVNLVPQLTRKGTNIASAASISKPSETDFGLWYDITGTTTITSLWNDSSLNTLIFVRFTGSLTLTHNATSLILPGNSNIITSNGDRAAFYHLGSGNWICLFYIRQDNKVVVSSAGTAFTIESTDAGASSGPDLLLHRSSASPAVDDFIGRIHFQGKDSGGNDTLYGGIYSKITDPVNGTEDGVVGIRSLRAGTLSDWAFARGALSHASLTTPTEEGAFNATKYYENNQHFPRVLLQRKVVKDTTPATNSSNIIPLDNTIPQNTEGDPTLLTFAFTPLSNSSRISISVRLQVAGITGEDLVATICQSGVADVLAVGSMEGLSSSPLPMHIDADEPSVNTTVRTYSVRFGPGTSGSMHINRGQGANLFGGKLTSVMVIEEYV